MKLPDVTRQSIGPSVAQALLEDIDDGNRASLVIEADAVAGATIFARESVILAGQPWVDEVFAQLDEGIVVDWYIGDSQSAEPGDVICKLVGPARALLAGQRTALKFLRILSATATITAAFVDAIAGTSAKIVGTRQTLPGLRLAQLYALNCGGGCDRQAGALDVVQVTDNHIRFAGGVAAALSRAAAADSNLPVSVEVMDQAGLIAALDAGAACIVLVDFTLNDLQQAVATNRNYGYVAAELEVSGSFTLETARAVAETGVTYLSTDALTGDVKAADLSMVFRID